MFAPDADQMHVVNHCEGKPTEEKRNILQESARIARGDVTDLAKLDVSAFDAAIFPGEAASDQHCDSSLSNEEFNLVALCSFRWVWCG